MFILCICINIYQQTYVHTGKYFILHFSVLIIISLTKNNTAAFSEHCLFLPGQNIDIFIFNHLIKRNVIMSLGRNALLGLKKGLQ